MPESPIEALKMRFVKSEITQEQYKEMLAVLVPPAASSANAVPPPAPLWENDWPHPVSSRPSAPPAKTVQGITARLLISMAVPAGLLIIVFTSIYNIPLEPMYTAYGMIERHPMSLVTLPAFIFTIGWFIARRLGSERAVRGLAFGFAAIVAIQFFLVAFVTSDLPGHAVGGGWIPILFGTALIVLGAMMQPVTQQ